MSRDFDFAELFGIEIDGWCLGIQRYPGEIYPGLVHSVLRELSPSFRASIRHNHAFDLIEVAQKISKASKYLVTEKEICFATLAYFPNPVHLNQDQQLTMATIIDQVEQQYGGALDRLKRKWQREGGGQPVTSSRPPADANAATRPPAPAGAQAPQSGDNRAAPPPQQAPAQQPPASAPQQQPVTQPPQSPSPPAQTTAQAAPQKFTPDPAGPPPQAGQAPQSGATAHQAQASPQITPPVKQAAQQKPVAPAATPAPSAPPPVTEVKVTETSEGVTVQLPPKPTATSQPSAPASPARAPQRPPSRPAASPPVKATPPTSEDGK